METMSSVALVYLASVVLVYLASVALGPILWHCLPQNSAQLTEPCKVHESMGRKRKILR